MKFIGKIMLWCAMAFLVVAIIFLSLLLGDISSGVNAAFGIVGLASILAALICLTIGIVLFLKDDDTHNLAEPKDDAPKAH